MRPADESGDACAFTQRLAARCVEARASNFGTARRSPASTRRAARSMRVRLLQADAAAPAAERRCLRGRARQPQPAVAAAARHVAADLSGQGLFGDDTDRESGCRAAREPDRRRAQAGVLAAGRTPARRRHRRTQRLRQLAQQRALRRDTATGSPVCFRRPAILSRPRAGAGLRPATPSNLPYVSAHALPQSVSQYRPRHARLDARLRLGPAARRSGVGARAGRSIRRRTALRVDGFERAEVPARPAPKNCCFAES